MLYQAEPRPGGCDESSLPSVPPPASRSPRLGYAFAATAATLWALNGSLSRSLLEQGMPAVLLAELRAVSGCVVLTVLLAARRPALLRSIGLVSQRCVLR